MLAQKSIDELLEIRDRAELDNWRIGEIANLEWSRNLATGGYDTQGDVFSDVAHYAGCSVSQVEKMYALACKFTREIRSRYPGFLLGYFEVSAQFPGEELDVLEYVYTYTKEHGEWPRAARLSYFYRRDVLGHFMGAPCEIDPATGSMPPEPSYPGDLEASPFDPPPASLGNMLINFLKTLRNQLNRSGLSQSGRSKLITGIQMIEEVLPELVEHITING